jgi:hypothetical protein
MRLTVTHVLWGLPVAVVAAGLLAALWPAGDAPPMERIAAPPPALQPLNEAVTPLALVPTASPVTAPAAADALLDLSPEERQALASALADHPAREAEMRRVAGFLRLQRQVDAWRDSRTAQAEPSARRELAARIEAALPAALAARSVSTGEALQLQAQLIGDREPDADRAVAELNAWRSRHVPPAETPDRGFLAQQQALVAAYVGQPDKLEPALDALRRKHFPNPN